MSISTKKYPEKQSPVIYLYIRKKFDEVMSFKTYRNNLKNSQKNAIK